MSDLAGAMRRASAAHEEHEKRIGQKDANWPDWYAAYMVAEASGLQLLGQTVIMIGGSAGIGLETARTTCAGKLSASLLGNRLDIRRAAEGLGPLLASVPAKALQQAVKESNPGLGVLRNETLLAS